MQKKILIALYGIYFFGVQFLFSMSGGPQPLFLKLLGLPLLFVIPFVWALEEKKQPLKTRLFIVAFILPATVSLIAFWNDIHENLSRKFEKRSLIKNYEAALLTVKQEPGRAFLSCYLARLYEFLDCRSTLSSVSDAKFCRTLCSNIPSTDLQHLKICSTDRSSILLECAEVLISQMDPKAPYDACKAAGLLNYRGPAGPIENMAGYFKTDAGKYFHGFYKRCLETLTLDKKSEYKPLAEILKIDGNKIPRLTAEPLPE